MLRLVQNVCRLVPVLTDGVARAYARETWRYLGHERRELRMAYAWFLCDFLRSVRDREELVGIWANLMFGELAFALRREAVDGEALGMIVRALLDMVRNDGGVAQKILIEKFRGFSEVVWAWKAEGPELQESVTELCAVCPNDVDLDALVEFANGIVKDEIQKIRFLLLLWRGLGERVAKGVEEAVDALMQLDCDEEVPEFSEFMEAVIQAMGS
jgi:hypothetical protein